MKELRYLHTLNISYNRFEKVDASIWETKTPESIINQSLKVLVLIGMELDWGQIDILNPLFPFIEELHLPKNRCKEITSKYEISSKAWKNLKYLNLEENGIEDWEEI